MKQSALNDNFSNVIELSSAHLHITAPLRKLSLETVTVVGHTHVTKMPLVTFIYVETVTGQFSVNGFPLLLPVSIICPGDGGKCALRHLSLRNYVIVYMLHYINEIAFRVYHFFYCFVTYNLATSNTFTFHLGAIIYLHQV